MDIVHQESDSIEILRIKELKEAYFNRLIEELKENEKYQTNQDSLLLEIYLSHFYSKQCNDLMFQDFINIIEGGIHIRLETKIQSYDFTDKTAYNLRRNAFRQLSMKMKFLYNILRDSLQFEQQKFLEKYEYLRVQENSLAIVKQVARCFKREEYIWILFLRFGYMKATYWNQIHDAVFKSAASYSGDLNPNEVLSEQHPLLKSIESNLKAEVKIAKLTQEMKDFVIVPMLKEYFALDNPFTSYYSSTTTSPIAVVEKVHAAEGSKVSSKISAIISPLAVIKNDGATDGLAVISPLPVIGKSGAADGSSIAAAISPIGNDSDACVQIIRKKLLLLRGEKEPSKLSKSTVSIASKTHRSKSSTVPNSVAVLSDFLKATNISAQDAFAFFEKKNKVMARNKTKLYAEFTSFGKDDLIAAEGIRSYFPSDKSQTMGAGFCTCIVHAIRLLCLCTTAASQPELQDVLKIMVFDMKTKPFWNVDEVMSGLKLQLSSITFQSLAQSFAQLIGQSTYLGELSWTGILSTNQLTEQVKVLYHSNATNEGKNMLFISFSEIPAVNEIELPYVFHVQKDSYKGLADDEIIDEKTDTVTFLTAGMVYSCLEVDKPASFAFRFITYSRCLKDGQYQVYEHVDGKIRILHTVSHSLEKGDKPKTLRVVLQESGHSLIGLILVRNSNQGSARHPYLIPETIRSIPNPTTSDNSDSCHLTCKSLQKLNSTEDWLDDELVLAITHIMFSSLLEKTSSEVKISLRTSWDYQNVYVRRGVSERNKVSLNKMFSSKEYIFYIVNIKNCHWICLCISMLWKRIFTVDSMNSRDTCKKKADEVSHVLRTDFGIRDMEWVHLKSPDQRDSSNCGIFAALNAAFLFKSILNGSFTFRGPENMEQWSAKAFSEEDKANIRSGAKSVIYGDNEGDSLLKLIN